MNICISICISLIIWMNLRTSLALAAATPPTDGGSNKDVTEKIKLGDNFMNKIQRALRAKIIDDPRPGTGAPGVARGAPTAAGGPGGAGEPGARELAEKKEPTAKRLTNPYLDTTKNGGDTSRYTFADDTIDDIEVATDQSQTIERSYLGKSNSTGGENRRAFDRESTSETEAERSPALGGGGGRGGTDNRDKLEEFRRYVEQNPELLDQYMKMRASAGRRGGATPDPQQLDLAPARGGRVASKRLKGRVCQRSVLLPEGPKYDSRGRVYLAGFQRGARAFQQTRRPKLLLPRCCNCCRKSVLGCE